MKKIILIFAIFILIISFIILRFNIFNLPKNIISFFSSNITSNFHNISSYFNEKTFSIKNIKSIISENEKLKKENQDLIIKINDITEKNKELEIVADSLDFIKKYDYKLAKVITINKELNNTITINIGKNEGIEVGYPVVFRDGFIIGKIQKVSDYSSTVLLSIDKNSEIAATISGHDKSLGIINGSYGINFNFNYVSIKENINIDDIVVTSGIESSVPAGLIIGKVSKINNKSSDFFNEIIVTPIIPFENFRIVSVIINK